jgi:cell division protein FtsW (lipid II flippase)
MDQLKTVLNDWNKSKTERQKLQHTYVALIVIAIVVAGLVSLVNPDRGQQLTMVALVALLAFLSERGRLELVTIRPALPPQQPHPPQIDLIPKLRIN